MIPAPAIPVHLAVRENGTVAPLCGQWGASQNWTTIRGCVTCPRCIERLPDGADDAGLRRE